MDMVILFSSGESLVDVEGNGRWRAASIQTVLTENSILKTGRDGKIEIDIGGERIALGSETVVRLSDIVNNMGERDRMSWYEKLSDQIIEIFGAQDDLADMVVPGVRGDLEEEDEISWMGEDDNAGAEPNMRRIRAHYREGEYADAITLLRSMVQGVGSSEEHGEAVFYLGASLYNSVQYEEALPYLRESIRNLDAEFREPALLYYSFACFFTGQYDRAIDGFVTYVEEFEASELIPYAVLMLGKSYKETGDGERAIERFREIEEHYEHSAVYSDARIELRGL
jgi:tetratricopeptide (TPR) repeat protein